MKKKSQSPFVYSTDPNFKPDNSEELENEQTLPPAAQKLVVRLETKHRAGKAVTLIDGFSGKQADREALGKSLRNYCGTGGSSKDGEILIQGDQKDKVLQWLMKNGYILSKKR